MPGLIDADALMEYCNNQKDKTIDANDIARFPTVGGWINVKDGLPKKDGEYNVYDGETVFCAYYERGRKESEWTDDYEGYLDFEVTHWAPLPLPPKKTKKEKEDAET